MMDDPKKKSLSTLPEFKNNIKLLSKKYRNLKRELQPLFDQLIKGELPGDRLTDISLAVYKVRLAYSDAQKGKSGGFRLIYYVPIGTIIYLVTIYSKTEQSDISPAKLSNLLADIDLEVDE